MDNIFFKVYFFPIVPICWEWVISGLLPETWGYFWVLYEEFDIQAIRNCHSHIHKSTHSFFSSFGLSQWAPGRRPCWPPSQWACNQCLSPLTLRDILDKTLCDKACLTGRWFSPGGFPPPMKLLKMVLNTITLTNPNYWFSQVKWHRHGYLICWLRYLTGV